MLNRDLRVEAGHRDAGRVAGDGDRIVGVGAVGDDLVGLAVARRAAEGAGEVEVDALDVGAGRSLTVTASAPPSALKSTRSTPWVSIVMFTGLRKNRRWSPFADRSTVSDAAAPLNTMVSVPSLPSIVSLPSPGSQTNVSSPAPRSETSLPALPSMVSLPGPPFSVSAPAPPAIVSLPGPPSILVGIALVNAPFVSSMRTRSLPLRAVTLIL
jgi:hypothetical protein